jgi:alpha-glucosidase (family GH31 glycosyl hydrolase)
MTLSLNATHVDGSTEYNLHNLMGHLQAAATKTALDSDVTKTQRQFILSSGTFSGSGQYAGHSTQPNLRSWDTLKNSTAQIMNMNMFGIPFTGPDVCGTYGDIDEELCARWIQTSAFYPLARQYPEELGLEPFNMKEQKNKDMASASLKERLRYSRQLYTCMFEAKDSGNTCFDPVFFYFPTDDKAVEHTEKNFVFANSILVTPVNQPNVETVKSYLPAGQWVSMKDYKVTTSGGEEVEIAVQPDVAIQHLMPGKIVTKQMGDFMTTADLKNNVFTLVANRDTNGHAEGTLYIDDGITKDQPYDYMTFQLSANSFKKWVSGTSGNTKKMDKLVITNAADLQQVDFACVRATDDYAMTALEIGKDAT